MSDDLDLDTRAGWPDELRFISSAIRGRTGPAMPTSANCPVSGSDP